MGAIGIFRSSSGRMTFTDFSVCSLILSYRRMALFPSPFIGQLCSLYAGGCVQLCVDRSVPLKHFQLFKVLPRVTRSDEARVTALCNRGLNELQISHKMTHSFVCFISARRYHFSWPMTMLHRNRNLLLWPHIAQW